MRRSPRTPRPRQRITRLRSTAADGRAAGRPASAGGARRPGPGIRSRPRAWVERGAAPLDRRARRRPRCRSTIPATWRSSPALRPRVSTLFDLLVGRPVDLRRQLARELRRGLRREPGAALDLPTWPACPPAPAAASSQGGTIGNLSALVAARHTARERARRRAPGTLAGRDHRRDPLLRRLRAAQVMDVDVLLRAGRRARPDDRRGARGQRSTRPATTACLPSWRPPAPPTSA